MSTKADFAITEKLNVRIDLDGHPFDPDENVCATLTGVSGCEFDYHEHLTIAQSLELACRLHRAATERVEHLRWQAKERT